MKRKALIILSTIIIGTISVLSVTATSSEVDYDSIWDNIIVSDNKLHIIDNTSGNAFDFTMNYIIPHNESIITNEYFNLSDKYAVECMSQNELEDIYSVSVETSEELDNLFEAATKLYETDTIKNGYKSFNYYYSCLSIMGSIIVDENSGDFDLNTIEGLDKIILTQSSKASNIYTFKLYDGATFINYKKAESVIENMDNVKINSLIYQTCDVLHPYKTAKIYIKNDLSIVKTTTISTETTTASTTVTTELTSEPTKTTTVTTQPTTTSLSELTTTTTTITTITAPQPTEQLKTLGDADGDNELTVRDCSFIAIKIAHGRNDELSDSADYNNDGEVNVRDAAAIAKALAVK